MKLKVIEIKASKSLGGGTDYLVADETTDAGDVMLGTAAVYCQVHDRNTADLFVFAVNTGPSLAAALRAVLPYAESRAEDMLDCAQENEETAASVPESEEAARTATRTRADADKAVAAVDAAKALLASLGSQ